jgi:hypothetical protein
MCLLTPYVPFLSTGDARTGMRFSIYFLCLIVAWPIVSLAQKLPLKHFSPLFVRFILLTESQRKKR